MSVTVEDILAARERIGDAIYHSPCPYSLSLSRLCGCEIYCKLDHLQLTGSFKERGARNRLLTLSEEQRRRGVVAASAGNHALGLAYHGRDLGVPVLVVMPKWAPLIKVNTCRQLGAEVVQHGESYDDALSRARELGEEQRRTFVSGFDDPAIIAGQGTIGLEILQDVPDVDAVVVPVGGGGLISGIGTAIKARRPGAAVIGVEAANAPTLKVSLERGEVTRAAATPTLADGLAVARFGTMCFEIVQRVMDRLVVVDEAQIAQAVLRLLELEKMVIEGAGAVSLAAMLGGGELIEPREVHPPPAPPSREGGNALGLGGKKVVLVLSGGNIDVTLISRIIDRGLAADGRLCRIIAHVSDRPGSLAHLTAVLAATGASVKEVAHDRLFSSADVALVSISCIMETRDFEHIREVHEALRRAGINFDAPANVRQGWQPAQAAP
jgi:threonine dehydratase